MLTGCIMLLDIVLENASTVAKAANCEDAVNLVRAKGSIYEISINDAISDGLDADFSSLSIESANISGAGNDCVDFSGDNYKDRKSKFDELF